MEMQAYCKSKWEVIQGSSQLGIGAINQSEVWFCSLLMKHMQRLAQLTESQYAKRLPELHKWFQQEWVGGWTRFRQNIDP